MSFLFYEPFEPALYVRDRPYAPRAATAGAVTSFNPARRRFSDALFEDEVRDFRARRFAKGYAAGVPSGRAFALHRRLAVTLAAFPEDAWSDPPPWTRRRFGGTGYTPPNGRTASFTVSFTGRSDDPYADAGLGAASATGLAADPNQALAVQTSGNFTGVSAARAG